MARQKRTTKSSPVPPTMLAAYARMDAHTDRRQPRKQARADRWADSHVDFAIDVDCGGYVCGVDLKELDR